MPLISSLIAVTLFNLMQFKDLNVIFAKDSRHFFFIRWQLLPKFQNFDPVLPDLDQLMVETANCKLLREQCSTTFARLGLTCTTFQAW